MKRDSFEKNDILQLGRHILADDLERKVIDKYKEGEPTPYVLLIDFKNTEFIELATLLVLTSLIRQRKDDGLRTYIGLPHRKRVRDFLLAWRFPDSFNYSGGIKFEQIVVSEDRQFLSEKQETYTGKGNAIEKLQWDPDWSETSHAKRNFFEFTNFSLKINKRSTFCSNISSDSPRYESQRWGKPLVQEVLKKHLSGQSPIDDVARVIIYEAMSNAVRHPNAKTIQTASRFYFKNTGSEKSKDHLLICIWDDGDSIASTLIKVLEEGKPIRTKTLPTFLLDSIYCQVKNFGDKEFKHEIKIHEALDVNKITPRPGSALVISLFPGVSRFAADSTTCNTFQSGDPEEYINGFFIEKGIGLYALKKTVVDQFQGKLHIRSGRHYLRIQKAYEALSSRENVKYWYRLKIYPDYFPEFRGNLLTISLPLRNR